MSDHQDYNQHYISDIVKDVLKKYNLSDKLEEINLYSEWEKIMGKTVADHTDSIKLQKGLLSVKIRSAALRNELMMARSKIVAKLNEAIKRDIIKDVIFR